MRYDNRQKDKARSLARRMDRQRKYEARSIEAASSDSVNEAASPVGIDRRRYLEAVKPCPVISRLADLKAA